MDSTGCDCSIDAHGDEGLAYNFFASAEGIDGWTPRLANLYDLFQNIYCDVSPDFQKVYGYEFSPGQVSFLLKNLHFLLKNGFIFLLKNLHFLQVLKNLDFLLKNIHISNKTGQALRAKAGLRHVSKNDELKTRSFALKMVNFAGRRGGTPLRSRSASTASR